MPQRSSGDAKGRWTPQEDRLLQQAFAKHGPSWSTVAKDVPGRNADLSLAPAPWPPQECWKRWRDNLDPKLNRKSWSCEEDRKLIDAFKQHGSAWAVIAKSVLPSRSGLQIKNRWDHLKRKSHRAEESLHWMARGLPRIGDSGDGVLGTNSFIDQRQEQSLAGQQRSAMNNGPPALNTESTDVLEQGSPISGSSSDFSELTTPESPLVDPSQRVYEDENNTSDIGSASAAKVREDAVRSLDPQGTVQQIGTVSHRHSLSDIRDVPAAGQTSSDDNWLSNTEQPAAATTVHDGGMRRSVRPRSHSQASSLAVHPCDARQSSANAAPVAEAWDGDALAPSLSVPDLDLLFAEPVCVPITTAEQEDQAEMSFSPFQAWSPLPSLIPDQNGNAHRSGTVNAEDFLSFLPQGICPPSPNRPVGTPGLPLPSLVFDNGSDGINRGPPNNASSTVALQTSSTSPGTSNSRMDSTVDRSNNEFRHSSRDRPPQSLWPPAQAPASWVPSRDSPVRRRLSHQSAVNIPTQRAISGTEAVVNAGSTQVVLINCANDYVPHLIRNIIYPGTQSRHAAPSSGPRTSHRSCQDLVYDDLC